MTRRTQKAPWILGVAGALGAVACGDASVAGDAGADATTQTQAAMIPEGLCQVSFEAAVRSGPSMGTTLVGLLAYAKADDGTMQGARLYAQDGSVIEVAGRITGRDVEMTFALSGGRSIRGTGRFEEDGGCSGQLAGPLTGPTADDRGDWLGDVDATDSFTVFLQSYASNGVRHPGGQVSLTASVSPTDHVLMITDRLTGETRVVAGTLGRTGVLNSPTAVVRGAMLASDGLLVANTGSGQIQEYGFNLSATGILDLINASPNPVITSLADIQRVYGGATAFRPRGLAFKPRLSLFGSSSSQELIFADAENHTLWAVTRPTTATTLSYRLLAGRPGMAGSVDGPVSSATLTGPSALSPHRYSSGQAISIVERPSCRLRQYDGQGQLRTLGDSGGTCASAVAVGMPCDPNGVQNVCAASATCILRDGMNRCVADGAIHGRCRVGAESACDPMLRCQSGTCVARVAVGETCSLVLNGSLYEDPCLEGSRCLSTLTGRRCVNDGARDGQCRTGMSDACDANLLCAPNQVCLPSLTVGQPCGGALGVCAGEADCRALDGQSVCVARGERGGLCRADGSCAATLTCNMIGTARVCGRLLLEGDACTTGSPDLCPSATQCRALNGSLQCIADGDTGGACRTAAGQTPCDPGLACVSAVCVSQLVLGDPCGSDVSGVCPAGSSCAPGSNGSSCIADGAADGRCRTTTPACDGALSCGGGYCRAAGTLDSPCDPAAPQCATGLSCVGAGAGARCLPILASGAACDYRSRLSVCPVGEGCVASSATAGTCGALTPEAEPNNVPNSGAAQSGSRVYSGTIGASGDTLDCHRVEITQPSSVYAHLQVGDTPDCVGSPRGALTFYYFGQRLYYRALAGTSCAALTPERYSILRRVPVGVHAFCVSAASSNYRLTLAVVPN